MMYVAHLMTLALIGAGIWIAVETVRDNKRWWAKKNPTMWQKSGDVVVGTMLVGTHWLVFAMISACCYVFASF